MERTPSLDRHAPSPPTGDSPNIKALLRAVDWSASPVGPPRGWSQALRGTIDAILGARVQIVLFWGPDYVAFYNDDYAPTIGDKHPRALGRPAREHWGELWDDLGPLLDRVRLSGESISAKDRPFFIERHGAGEEVYFDISYSPVRDSAEAIGGVLCIVAETTDRVRSQRRAIGERERLARMFEQAPGFMAMLREPGHVFELANAAYQQLIGHRSVIGLSIAEALPELAAQGFIEILDDVVAQFQPHVGHATPVMLQRLPGGAVEERLVDFLIQPIRDADGQVTALFIEGSDVTERVRTQQKLALTEDTARLANEAGDVGTWDFDVAADRFAWSDRAKLMFAIGDGPDDGVAGFLAALHPDDRDGVAAKVAATLDPAQRAPYDVEYRTIGRTDGVTRWIAARGRAMFDEGGRCVRAIGTVVDISPRKRAQEELRESEARFRSLADTAPALIWMCDGKGALAFANRWHEETFGRPTETLLGGAWQDVIHPSDAPGFTADFDAAFEARAPFGRDVRVIDRNGATRWLHSEARPRFVEGLFAGYVGCDVDVTDAHLAAEALERGIAQRTGELAATNRQLSSQIEERERVEATLRQMQRLEAIGQLTAGVAHDFNNLLTVVLGNVDMVARAVAEAGIGERTRQRLGYMRTAAERGAALTGQLLAFSRRQRLEPRATDLNETVAGMRDLLQSSMGGSVRLSTTLADDLWPALVDPTQIELIILNLAINARDAMEVGGALTVTTGNVSMGDPAMPEEPAAGDYVMIAVADSGTGMTPEVLAKAFEPFFTTKAVGKGSGLGLAQVFGFARQSGGGVGIETTLGQGTTVRVYLPRSPHAAGSPEEQARHDVADNGAAQGRHVLVVDDDEAVREVSASLLRAMGCIVEEADSGIAALARLDRADAAFDLAVLDFAMPGMNGAELAAAIARRRPDLPVLFVTGYAELSALGGVEEERIVQKPYRGGAFERKARALLADGVTR